MLSTVVLPWIHYVAIMMMAGALVAELYLLRLEQSQATVRLLPRVDMFYGAASVAVFVTGILRIYFGGKGPDWYWANGLMHGVIGVFVLAGLISLIPTLRFRRWAAANFASGALPSGVELRKIRPLIHTQLSALALIALMITAVAKGYGYHGG